MERWAGKVAIVTGASSGIGADIALRLANYGVIVVGVARRKQRIDDLAKQVTGKGKIHSKQSDLSKPEETKEAFDWVEQKFGGADIVINNAAVLFDGSITAVGDKHLTDANMELLIDLNIKSLLLSARYAIDSMKRRNVAGHIVNINSVLGHYIPSYMYTNVYTATKHAVTAITTSLVNELAHFNSKIKITSLSPGTVKTEMTDGLIQDDVPALEASDIAEAAIFALSSPPSVNIYELGVKAVGEGML